jgi:hypothetical protein
VETILTILASTGAISYLGGKLSGWFARKTRSKILVALDTAVQLGRQLVLSGATTTPDATIRALKGTIAVTLAKSGFYEKHRKPIEPLIDLAIGGLVTEWYQHTASRILPPIAAKVLP